MRILYVIDSLVGGGAEVSTRTMAGELARRGHTVKVIVLRALDDLGIAGPDVVVEVLPGRRFGQRVRVFALRSVTSSRTWCTARCMPQIRCPGSLRWEPGCLWCPAW